MPLVSHVNTQLATREQLAMLPTPEGTATHKPIPHIEIVNALVEMLHYRSIGVIRDEYAITADGNRMFGVLDLEVSSDFTAKDFRFNIGIRNSHDKTMRLAMTVGTRVFICDNMAFSGDFTPVLKKHSKKFDLNDALALGVHRMQQNFAPMQKQIEDWRAIELTDVNAKMVIYQAFIEGKLDINARHLARVVHELYFDPQYDDFRPRTIWSLSNAFTSAFKELDPVPQFKATAKLGGFLDERFPQARLLAPKGEIIDTQLVNGAYEIKADRLQP